MDMCNRCDGGNKQLIEMKCNNSGCGFVFYQVEEVHIGEDKTCPICREGVGILEKKEGEIE